MSWLTPFILGRPGNEFLFEINPEGMDISESAVVVTQRNLAGDLKKSVIKTSCPTIKINSSFLSLAQRNQFNSLVGISDTFLSFQTRNDWQVVNELVTIIDTLHLQISNSSAARLSATLVALGQPSIITIGTPFTLALGAAWGGGIWGGGVWGGSSGFNPGPVTYTDATRIITMTNPLPNLNNSVYVSYVYTGWLVSLETLGSKYKGGWIDRATYDITLQGA